MFWCQNFSSKRERSTKIRISGKILCSLENCLNGKQAWQCHDHPCTKHISLVPTRESDCTEKEYQYNRFGNDCFDSCFHQTVSVSWDPQIRLASFLLGEMTARHFLSYELLMKTWKVSKECSLRNVLDCAIFCCWGKRNACVNEDREANE